MTAHGIHSADKREKGMGEAVGAIFRAFNHKRARDSFYFADFIYDFTFEILSWT